MTRTQIVVHSWCWCPDGLHQRFSFVSGIAEVSSRNTLSGETFCFLEKFLLSIFKFRALSNLLFSYELLIGPQPTFLECTAYIAWVRTGHGKLNLPRGRF